jgi:CheY-like chemotaxis protein
LDQRKLAFAPTQVGTYCEVRLLKKIVTIPTQFVVLCVGQHQQLLAIRDTVLRTEGYRVIEAHTTDEALYIFNSTDVDIVVICHSIPIQSRKRLVLAMKEARPLTPVIALHEAYDLIAEADESVDQLAGPEALLESMTSLLKKPVQRVGGNGSTRHLKSTL